MPRTADLLKNRFDRYAIAPGLVGWVYEYRNAAPVPIPWFVSTGIEIGVQLAGDWVHEGSRTGKRLYSPGMIHSITPTEHFHYQFQAAGTSGVVVGFTLYPDELEHAECMHRDLVFAKGAALTDDALFRFARAFMDAADRGCMLDAASVRHALFSFIGSNTELPRPDPLLVAKAELEHHFDRPLYIADIAAAADMHPAVFARAFKRRFGLTPARYRLELRLNEAVRLAWSRLDLSLRAIAERIGFEDMSYFHRAFQRKFWLTPAQSGRRRLAEAAA